MLKTPFFFRFDCHRKKAASIAPHLGIIPPFYDDCDIINGDRLQAHVLAVEKWTLHGRFRGRISLLRFNRSRYHLYVYHDTEAVTCNEICINSFKAITSEFALSWGKNRVVLS